MVKKNYFSFVMGKLLILIYAVFLLVPMYMVVITSLKSKAEFYTNPIGLPQNFQFSNFYEAFVSAKILKYGANSLFVTGVSVFLIVVFNVLCAYGIYKIFNKRIGTIIYGVIMLGLMIPGVGYITTILLYRSFHLYNTLYALIVSAVAGSVPFSMFILVGFLRTLPKELDESAKIDGCNDLQALFYVMVPNIKPAVITIAIFNMLTTWNNLFTPLILITKEKYFTLPLGLLAFRGNYSTQYNLMFAGALIVSIPLLLVYFKFQKYFVDSLSGGVKG